MADTIKTKRITDLPEDTDVNDNDLFMAGSNGTASLRKKKWSTLLAKIKSKLLANNLTTTAEGYALDARQGKALKDQVDQLNTKIKIDKWGENGEQNLLDTTVGIRCFSVNPNSNLDIGTPSGIVDYGTMIVFGGVEYTMVLYISVFGELATWNRMDSTWRIISN